MAINGGSDECILLSTNYIRFECAGLRPQKLKRWRHVIVAEQPSYRLSLKRYCEDFVPISDQLTFNHLNGQAPDISGKVTIAGATLSPRE